jgi:hypothetical protein
MLRGEDIIIGVGVEDPNARGTAVAPQAWIPARAPSGIKAVLNKVLVKETRGSKIASSGSDIAMSHAEGPVEFNVRAETIGFFLKALLGDVTSTPRVGQSGVVDHQFDVLAEDPEHPTITAALHQPGVQDYEYPGALPASLAIEIVPGDLVKATVPLIARSEDEATTFDTTALDAQLATDVFFRHYDVSVKFAANVAGLGAATATRVKELGIEIANGARPDQAVDELNPGNVIATVVTAGGKIKIDVDDTTLYDLFKAGTIRAAQVVITRSDVNIAATAIHPSITFTFPNVTFEANDFDRPIDDIAAESLEFTAHYDATAGYAVRVALVNGREDYDHDAS